MRKGMKRLRRWLTLLVCVSVSIYALPAFPSDVSSGGHAVVKRSLDDDEMAKAVGGNGSVDAIMADYSTGGGEAQAVIANRTTIPTNYSLEVIDSNGSILENLVSGTLNSGEAMLLRGTPTIADNSRVRVRVWNSGVPGMTASDTSWASQ